MYGGGALLSSAELTRRVPPRLAHFHHFSSASRYAIIEEAFTTQSLFNTPLPRDASCSTRTWIPSLGISAWWALFMLNIHPFWSIGVSIATHQLVFPPPAKLHPSPSGLFPVAPSFSESAAIGFRRGEETTAPLPPAPITPSVPTPQPAPATPAPPHPLARAYVGLSSRRRPLHRNGCACQHLHVPVPSRPLPAPPTRSFSSSALVVVAFIAAAFLGIRHQLPAAIPASARSAQPTVRRPGSWVAPHSFSAQPSRTFPPPPVGLGRRRLDSRRRPHLSACPGSVLAIAAAWSPLHTLSIGRRRRARLRSACIPSTPRRPLPQMGRPPQPHPLSGFRARRHRNRRSSHALRDAAQSAKSGWFSAINSRPAS